MHLRFALIALAGGGLLLGANWPQAAGPDGNWRIRADNAPVEWSVSLNHNILWRTPLPPSFSNGVLYHRTLKEAIAIGRKTQ